MGRRLPLVDAHVHLWELGAIRYPWLTPPFGDDGPNGSVERIARDYGIGDYLADAAGWDVRGIVHVEAGADPRDALLETERLQALADAGDLPIAIVAAATLDDPDVDRLLEAHARHPSVRGVRHIVNWHADPRRTYTPRDLTADERWRSGFARLGHHGLSFDLQAYPKQFLQLAPFLESHPEVPVVVDHLGMMVGPDGRDEWLAGMSALAGLRHVHVKISGLGFAFRPWSLEQAHRYVLEAVDLFGASRCMVASDFPTDSLFGGFDEHLDAYGEIMADLSDAERGDMFAGNANRFYRLGLSI